MENISLFSEYYLSFCFFFIFVIGIFFYLSKQMNFPNYYDGVCCLFIITLINSMFIDIWNRFDNYVMYDLYKDTGDIYMKLLLFLLIILFLFYSTFYVKSMNFNNFEFLVIIFFIVMNINYFILVTDIISFYLILEILSLSYYLLTSFNKKNQYSIESGLKYFILSSFSSVLLLFGFSFLYGITGMLNISDMNLFFSNIIWNSLTLGVYLLSLLLIFVAFLFKLYVAPFHIWVSDIYQGAPFMSVAFFGTITSLPLFYVLCKYYLSMFVFIEYYLFYIILILVILSMIFGVIGGLYQRKIKRLIAFSSVSSIGYIFIGFLEDNMLILSNAFNYFIVYSISVIGLFVVFLNLYLKKYNFFLERLSLLYGFVLKNKILALIIVILFFSVAGMPPFSLFIVKILLITGISYQLYSVLLFTIVLTSILSSFYYLKIIKIVSFENKQISLFFSKLSYIVSLLLLLLVIFQLTFSFNSEYITILGDYIVLSLNVVL